MTIKNRFSFKLELKNFIYFSHSTTGSNGRAIKIHKDLFLPFFCGVDPKTHDGQFIIRQIEQLRTTPHHLIMSAGIRFRSPGYTQQLQNLQDNTERMLTVKNVQIMYRISQEAGDRTPTVYIEQARIVDKGDNNSAGFYSRNKLPTGGRGPVTKMKEISLEHRTVFINGLADSLDEAMAQSGNSSSVLFYNPAKVCNDLGVWGAGSRSSITNDAIKELTEGLQLNKSKKVKWVIEGEGGGILTKALKNVKGSLTDHKFKITNPKSDTPKLLQAITEKKGVLPEMFLTHSQNEMSLIATASHKEALIKQIGLLPVDKGMRKKIVSKIESNSDEVKPIMQQATIGVGSKNVTFVQALNSAGIYRK